MIPDRTSTILFYLWMVATCFCQWVTNERLNRLEGSKRRLNAALRKALRGVLR